MNGSEKSHILTFVELTPFEPFACHDIPLQVGRNAPIRGAFLWFILPPPILSSSQKIASNALPVDGIPVIFITAHPEHAVRAFEVNAIDYLLKPVDPQRLKQSLTRVSGSGSNEERPFTRDEKVLFRDGSKNILLRVGDIQVLEASEAYTRLILGDGRGITINGTLKSVRDRLDPDLFFSASRSHAINLDHVANVEDIEGGFMILTMANGVKVELSRRHSTEFRRLKSV